MTIRSGVPLQDVPGIPSNLWGNAAPSVNFPYSATRGEIKHYTIILDFL